MKDTGEGVLEGRVQPIFYFEVYKQLVDAVEEDLSSEHQRSVVEKCVSADTLAKPNQGACL